MPLSDLSSNLLVQCDVIKKSTAQQHE